MISLFQYAFFFVFHLPLRFFLRPHINGIEHVLINGDVPRLIIANHITRLDPFLLALLPFRAQKKMIPYRFPTVDSYYRKLWIQFFIRPLGAYKMTPRAWTLDEYFSETKKYIFEKNNILLFPEGRLVTTPFEVEAKPGFIYLPSELSIAILPLHIRGLSGLTFWDFLLRRRSVTLTFGEEFSLSDVPIYRYRDTARGILEGIYAL